MTRARTPVPGGSLRRASRAAVVFAWVALACAVAGCALLGPGEPTVMTDGESPTHIPDVPFFMTGEPVVEAMIDLAGVRAGDAVYDLGCGDGRIVIAAALRGASGVGIDMDPAPLNHARTRARRAGVEGRVRFVRGDFFGAPLGEASVVMLYLSQEVNLRLRPKLLAELAPGSRIVSHKFDMGEAWRPDRTVRVGDEVIYLWVVPAGARPPVRPQ